MHVLHIDLGREMRGGQHQVLLLLKVLRDAGHSFTLLARPESPLFAAARGSEMNVQPASLYKLRVSSAEHDIVHAHDAKAHSWAALVARRPFVVSRRVAFEVGQSALSRWKYRRAARFLAVSQYVAGQLAKAGVEPARVDVVYDAVEAGERSSWRSGGAIVALASSDPQKGRDLIERAEALGRRRVRFSTDLVNDLAAASLFVYISRSEGFGSAALLAMSRGVPVIASRIGGMVELFEDGVSGLLVENDEVSIAAAMERILTDPALAQSLAENARERVQKLFSPSCLLLQTLASYRRAL